MSMFLDSVPALSQHNVVSTPSAVGGLSLTSRAPGVYDVYWKMSPVSLRRGRCRMTSASMLLSGPLFSPSPPPQPTEPSVNSAAPIAMLWMCCFTDMPPRTSEAAWYKSRANSQTQRFRRLATALAGRARRATAPYRGVLGVDDHTRCIRTDDAVLHRRSAITAATRRGTARGSRGAPDRD